MYDIIAITVARTSNRVFVGTTLCKSKINCPGIFKIGAHAIIKARNEGFLKNAVDYARAVVISAELIRAFPDWLKE